jgi:hypothetical protein
MSVAVVHEPVLVMVSVLHGGLAPLGPAEEALTGEFGAVGLRSGPFPFELTGYYEREMGGGLRRVWLAFEVLQGADRLPAWKLACSGLEERLSAEGRRRYNLDPGYLDHGKLVLASFKAAPDKIYMGDGVYAHTCLRYRFGGFCAPDHSFPDFADGRFDSFMAEAKRFYSLRLRNLRSHTD